MTPYDTLGISDTADDAAVHAAYLEAVRRSPPDRDPKTFQEVRDAYELLRDASARRRLRLFGGPGPTHFVDLAPRISTSLPAVGLEAWRALLTERKG